MIDSIPPQHLEANSRSFSATMADRNNKRKRRPAGTPEAFWRADPDAEVVALSPRTLMESDRYVCEICNQGFQRDQNLQMHRRRHKVPWKLLKRPTPDIKKRVYVCPDPTCLHNDPAHALGDLVGIKKHFRRKHSLEKQWKCEKCSKGYAVQSDYKAHLKTCGTRGHSCDCGRVFSRVESFIEHQDNCSTAKERAVLSYSDRPVTYTNNNSTTRRPPMLGEELPFLSSSPWKRFTTENQPQSAHKKDDSNMVLQLNLSVGATKENDQNPLGIMITNGRNSSCLSHANGGTDRSNKHWADFLASPSKRTKPSIESKEGEGLSEATTTEPELANATSSVSDSRCSGTTERSSSSKDETHHVFLQNRIDTDAERVKEMAKRQLEIAEAEFAMARKIEAEAQLMLRRANILRGEAMRHINETTMEITCQSCRHQFLSMVSPPCENKMNLDLNIGHASSETRPPHFYSPPK